MKEELRFWLDQGLEWDNMNINAVIIIERGVVYVQQLKLKVNLVAIVNNYLQMGCVIMSVHVCRMWSNSHTHWVL